ncbi:hypothetical protein [Stenotrophomonas sp. MMGLT7]|uniref:hypothetical protein n=1 Tax=Stenotrophomonas sp. MMGLT7 TaxID=2901227 RepID=UPI001E55E8F4|nr:hypothetical protein [Stenotrophomonas sp. MMGLT7]MCD7100306.1 hypothetical protein [Stenotrophomonas sp. MMGLT7]
MNRKRFQQSIAKLFVGGLLLGGGWLVAASDRVTDPDAEYGASKTGQENQTPTPQAPPARRLRSSLSMPYFSFAHSLRPRS